VQERLIFVNVRHDYKKNKKKFVSVQALRVYEGL